MTINETRKHFGLGDVVPLIKSSAIVPGLIVIGCVAVAAAVHALSPSTAKIVQAVARPEMTAGPATAAPGSRSSTKAASARDARDDDRGQIDATRECRPDAGIVTECIFN